MRVLHNLLKKSVTILMVATLVVTCVFSGTSDAWAAVGDTGRVTYSAGLNVRSGAGTGYSILGTLAYGDEFVIQGEVKASDGYVWYKLNFNGSAGYVRSDFVEIVKTVVVPDEPADEWDQTKQGVVINTANVNVRSGPGPSYSKLGSARFGDTFTVYGENDGWYKLKYEGTIAYISKTYMEILDKDYEYDSAFEEYLTEQGFPESYKPYLRVLHANYPEWEFVAYHTDLSWATVLSKENKSGINLIYYTMPDSWKVDNVSQDSGGYVNASKAAIAYYLDPRNLLNVADIFQFLDHSYDGTIQTSSGLQNILNGTFMSGSFPESTYKTYNGLLMDVGKESGVNPFVLASMIIVEQGTDGSGRSIAGTVSGYEGYYNHFNVNAYATSTLTAVQNGLSYASKTDASEYRPWNSRYKSIRGGATIYGKNYVKRKQNSLYLKKFNVMNGSNNVGVHQYMTNIQGAENEAIYLRLGYSNILDSAIKFVIPIYNNMPTHASPEPGTTTEIITDTIEVTAGNRAKDGKVQLQWNVVEGAGVYEVYRSTSKAGSYSMIGTTMSTEYVDETAKEGSSYYYKVKAKSLENSSYVESSAILRTCDLAKPTNVKASNVASSGKPKVTWDAVSGADKYEVYRKIGSNGTYEKYTTTTKTSFVHEGAKASKTYYYKVRAVDEDNKYATSAYSSAVQRACDLAKPTNVKASNVASSGKPKITWDEVSGADKYAVYRKIGSDGTYEKYTTTTKTYFVHEGAKAGKTYYYKVKAIDAEKESATSAYSSVVQRACDLEKPTNVKASNVASSGKPKITWDAVSGADKYEVYRKIGEDGTYKKHTTTTKTSFIHEGAKAGQSYYYKVKAIDADKESANSAYSGAVKRACDLPSPEVKIELTSAGKPRISWSKVEGATQYEVWRKVGSNGTYEKYFIATGTSMTNTVARKGTTYYYKVKAIYGGKSSANSAFSNVVYKTSK